MIIKSLSRREGSFAQLIGYIARGHNPRSLHKTKSHTRNLADNLLAYIDKDHDPQNPPLTQNLPAETVATRGFVQAFQDNADLLPQRKNGVTLYHEILSFNEADTPNLSYEVMADLTRKYLSLRAPAALAYAKFHFDTGHKHVHILLSANDLGRARRNRLSKAQFKAIKNQLEAYQRDRYPQLSHSLAQNLDQQLVTKPDQTPKRPALAGLDGPPSRKILKTHVLDLLATTHDPVQFLDRLNAYGFELVLRGKTYTFRHLASDKRFRLRALDLLDAYTKAQSRWQQTKTRLEELERNYAEQIFWPYRQIFGTIDKIAKLIPGFTKPISRIGKRIAALKRISMRRFQNRSNRGRDR